MESSSVFLGIAGGSGSGKTHLAQRVRQLVGEEGASVISMDYYFRGTGVPAPEDINFDHPNYIDFDLLLEHLATLKSGQAVRAPAYDFVRREQTLCVHEIRPTPVVMVEGLFVLSEPVVDQMDMSCFLDVSDDQRLLGRILRDIKERDGEIDAIVDRYQRFVRPSYHVFVAPSRQNADVVVDFTYRRALFTHLLAHIIKDFATGQVDLIGLLKDLRRENYTLGYQADDSIMPMGIDVRRLATAYPESAYPKASGDGGKPRLHLTSNDTEH